MAASAAPLEKSQRMMSPPNARPRAGTRGLRWSWLLLLCLTLAGCGNEQLLGRLQEQEANVMAAILESGGIPVTKTAGSENTYTLSVPSADFARSVELLHSMGFPRRTYSTIGDVFQSSGMVSSPGEDRIRFMYALSESLGETLTQIDGVVSARVHITLPNNDPLSDSTFPSSASVLIKHRLNARIEPLRPQVKSLVANSVEGLEYANVSLVLVPAEPLQLPDEPSRVTPDESHIWDYITIAVSLVLAFGCLGFYFWLGRNGPATGSQDVAAAPPDKAAVAEEKA